MPSYKPPYNNDFKPQTVEAENIAGDYRAQPHPTFGQRLKNHFRRFWWLHVIIFIIGFLIVLLCLLFVAMPHIAQDGINAAQLELYQQIVTDATPNSVHLHMVTISQSNSTFHPTIQGFNGSLFLEDTEPNIVPFAYIQIPTTQSLSTKYIVVDQTLNVSNMDQFIAYNKLLLSSQTYRVALRGKTTIHEGSFPPAHVDFNKVVTSQGFNNLQGFQVLNFNVSLTPAADGSNLRGQVYIPNPSPISVSMGQVVQNLYVDGQYIGNNTIANLQLNPGNNVLNFTGISDQATVINLISTKYTNGILPVTIVGNSSIINGQHIPYFEAALQSVSLQAELNVGAALSSLGLNIGSLGGTSSSASSASGTTTATSSASSASSVTKATSSTTASSSTTSSSSTTASSSATTSSSATA